MTKGDWWRHGVFYQIYPRSFQDSNADGIGDLPGIIDRLDHLAWLGVDAIWLSPHYPSPMRDFGYDVSDYTGVDPRFGTPADFDRFLREAHRRNIRVIVDLVPNHTSAEHPWFVEARASRTSPKRDWFIWADPRPDGSPPNNWRSAFQRVGPAWTLDARTGQYYLHHFLPEQPDLNWRNPEVWRAMDEVIRFWLERGVDGFRIDVAHGMMKDPELRDNPRVRAGHVQEQWNWDRPEVHDVHRHWRSVLDEYGERMAVGEVYILDTRKLVRYYGAGDELHLAFNFWFLRQPWKARAFRAAVEEFERLLPADAWPNYTLSNHDHSRSASRYGAGRARVAAVMLLTLRGTPFLYYGEEIGMLDVPVPERYRLDIHDRDPERTPMQWDATPHAGFTTGEPWLPVARDFRRRNVAAQREDARSILTLYHRLIELRRASGALRWGTYRGVGTPEGLYAYVRETDRERWLIVLNFRSRARRLDLSRIARRARLVLASGLDREGEELDLARLRVGPDQALLVRVAPRIAR